MEEKLYYKVIDDQTKEVLVAFGTDVEWFKSLGYVDQGNVEQSADGRYYVAGYAPEIPAEELEARRLAEAKRIRAEQVSTIIVEVDGMIFDGDEKAQSRMARAIQAAEITGAESTDWVLADNSVATVTVAQMKQALAKAMTVMCELWTKPYAA